MPMPEQASRWDLEDAELGQGFQMPPQDKTTRASPKQSSKLIPSEPSREKSMPVRRNISEPRSVLETNVAPLLKQSDVQDLDAARSIVRDARLQSSKLNKARVASPLRNKYKLKPGTVVGGYRVPAMNKPLSINADVNKDVPPLLTITDSIAAAAALVAEADAALETRNITSRAAQAGGTFWMQRSVALGMISGLYCISIVGALLSC